VLISVALSFASINKRMFLWNACAVEKCLRYFKVFRIR
jgi:hypothetical protein